MSDSAPRWTKRVDWGVVALVVVSYVPLLLTKPGKVGADTKTYLYLDPGRLLSRAPWMWDSNIGLGTVTHQNIGYLWPMGPYYWLMDAVGVPDWVAQRLWLGTIIVAAGLGVRWMLRELRWDGGGATVAAFAYALSPYVVDYAARLSVILLPFAGLPWLIGLAARTLRRGDWQSPAMFALVTLTVGGVNATSLLLVMVGPVLWFVYATFVEREVTFRRALAAGLRISVLTLATSLWWMAGLAIQGAYGISILRYTETYLTVATAALSTELLRGLGYWFFYGRDGIGAWTRASVAYIESIPALALSFVLPLLGFASAVATRWRHRAFFAAILLAGLVIGVGSHPWDGSSPYGWLFRMWSRTDMGLSFRSTPRAVPLIALALAVFVGAGVAALGRVRPRARLPVAVALVLVACLNMPSLFLGQMVDVNLMRDEELPQYWLDAAAELSAGDRDTRAWELPGIDFSSYRWGNTVDPITPGLTDRDYVARELIPYGTPPSANLLNEVDQPFQSGRVDPDALAPLARMLGVGVIVHRADLQYERFRTPRPLQTHQILSAATGLGEPSSFGEPVANLPTDLPLDDEMAASTPLDYEHPSPVMLFPVRDARPMLRTQAAGAPLLVAGDGSGLVALASAGRLDADRPVFYSGSFATESAGLAELAANDGAELVVTDTNRRQARRWGSVRENDGYTEQIGETPFEEDPTDNRLEVFPDAGDDVRTVSEQIGGGIARASAYGNGITYTPGDRAYFAFDGDPQTAWKVAAFDDPVGEYLQLDLHEPVTTDRITFLQTQGDKNRHLTEVSVSFDGGEPERVELGLGSLFPPGQEYFFAERSFSSLRITVEATDRGVVYRYAGISDVGLAEVSIAGVEPIAEVMRPPVDLLGALGDRSLDRPLSYVFSRRAANAAEALAGDEERRMARWVDTPMARLFTVYGKARLSAALGDDAIDRALGIPGAADGGVTATSSRRLPGSVRVRAGAAIDGDPTTGYQSPINSNIGNWLEFTYPSPISVDGLDMVLFNDGKHSLPTKLSISVDGGDAIPLDVGVIEPGVGRSRLATTDVHLETGPLVGTTFRLTIEEFEPVRSRDWFGGNPIDLPVGIAEVGLPARELPDPATPLDDRCRDDLVTLDSVPVPVRIIGTVGVAEDAGLLRVEACGDPVPVGTDRALLLTAVGAEAGFDIDLLALSSAAGGGPGTDTLSEAPTDAPVAPATTTVRTGRNSYEVSASDAQEPYWVVLGQSHSLGWSARTSAGVDLGEPVLVNGFANGWLVDPSVHGPDVTVELTWTPQRLIWIGLAVSAIGVLVCIAFLFRPPRRGAAQPLAPDEVARVRPVARNPLLADGPTVELRRAAAVAVGVAAFSWFVAGPVVAVAVALAAIVGMRVRRGQVVIRVAAVGLLALAAAFMVVKQFRNDFVLDFAWPTFFETVHAWGLAATLLLVLDVVVSALRRGDA